MKVVKDETAIDMVSVLKFKITQIFDYVETKE